MAALSNAKHEAFARSIVEGGSGRDAYRGAGYATQGDAATDAAASRLLSDVKVQARIAELQDRAATGTVTSAETLIEEGWAIIRAAKSDKQHAAASQTLERIAKIAGVWVDKSENKDTSDIRQWLKD
jgi:phage terminase small subunit